MIRHRFLTTAAVIFFAAAFVMVAGCAKQQALEESVAGTTPAVVVADDKSGVLAPGEKKELAVAESVVEDKDAALKAAALEEQAAREKAEKERQQQLLTEAAAFEDIGFDFDKYDLKPEARAAIQKLGEWLLANQAFVVTVEGHCDERGTTEYNLALGDRRANAAAEYLVALGVPAKRITTISYGEELPLDPGHNEEAWTKNRRDHFVITIKN
ncbi:MAG: peptidoglycan-associated lipoprotein Pal [Deltaproteobacteria bacterium]|nr:peptidoglycan-associated lipoprotein Pal [Deltaproteobacteria bacterium]